MIATRQPLMSHTAADLMTRSLVLVPRDMSLPGAARLLNQAKVTGAPVVDGQGRCIGVISATDFLQYTSQGARAKQTCCTSVHAWQILECESLPAEDRVADIMTRDPVTVTPGMPVAELARMMIDAHIHRLVVVDDDMRPIGIVSSTDILAAVAHGAA